MAEVNVFVICPVRDITEKEQVVIQQYIQELESKGHRVHYPPRDTNQNDPIGLNICKQNREAIAFADRIDIYWTSKSKGTLFDLGMAFALNKRFKLINEITPTPKKSFENVLLKLSENK